MSESIIIALLGSGALSALISGAVTLITRAQDRKHGEASRLAEIEKKLQKAEIDNVRLQMMVLMSDYPEEESELMKVAEHYFKDLGGNWYMTTMFNRWIQEHGIAEPEWFRNEKK